MLKQGKSNKSQAREPAKTDYGSSGNVRESTSKTFSGSGRSGKAKPGMYAKYK